MGLFWALSLSFFILKISNPFLPSVMRTQIHRTPTPSFSMGCQLFLCLPALAVVAAVSGHCPVTAACFPCILIVICPHQYFPHAIPTVILFLPWTLIEYLVIERVTGKRPFLCWGGFSLFPSLNKCRTPCWWQWGSKYLLVLPPKPTYAVGEG